MRLWLGLFLLVAACDGAPITPSGTDAGDAPTDAGAAAPADSGEPGLVDGGDTPPADVVPLAIATWNLEQFPRHPGTIDAVRDLIVEHQLDLIAVQEITDPEAFEALAEALPEHEMFVSFDAWAYTRVGFLYRPARIVVGEVERLFSRETWAFPRDPLMAELTVLDDEGAAVFDFTFVVVHLKAQVDEESRQRRVAAVERLDGWIRERVVIDPDVVVVGDFNDELTDAPEWNVFGPFLEAPELYRFLTMEAEHAGERSYIPFRAMLDHVLVTTDALDEYGDGTTAVFDIDRSMLDYRDRVSDHRPVVSRFAIGTSGSRR